MKSQITFTDPSGERLGLFHRPKPGTKIMPKAKPTLAEVRMDLIIAYYSEGGFGFLSNVVSSPTPLHMIFLPMYCYIETTDIEQVWVMIYMMET